MNILVSPPPHSQELMKKKCFVLFCFSMKSHVGLYHVLFLMLKMIFLSVLGDFYTMYFSIVALDLSPVL